METFFAELSSFFGWLVRSTIQVSILVCIVLVLKAVVRTRLGARWHYYLWLLVVARMIMPWAPESRISLFNLVPNSARLDRVEFMSVSFSKTDFKVDAPMAYGNDLRAQPTVSDTKETAAPAIESHTTNTTKVQPESVCEKSDTPEAGDNPITTHVESRKPFSEKLRNWRRKIPAALPLIWLAGAVVLLVYVFISNLRLWTIIRRERAFTNQKVLDLLEDCKAQMDVHMVLGVVVSDKLKSAALFGFVRPRLVLPAALIQTLSLNGLRHIFLHELAHLKRHDILLSWLTSLLLIMHWFNPLLWYAFYRMRLDREIACDGLTLSRMRPDESHNYGRTIVQLLEGFSHSRRLPIMAGVLENKSQLKRRMDMISQFKKNSYLWSVLAAVLILMVGCVTLTDPKSTRTPTTGCPPAPAADPAKTQIIESAHSGPNSKITFEETFHHFGRVGPETSHVWDFKFTNTGDTLLKIQKLNTSCSCTVATVSKQEYAPGESGTVQVKYKSGNRARSVRKYIDIYTNDSINPRTELAVRANIVLKVHHEPKELSLSLDEENAGCPGITLTSLDNQPFSITRFKSTADCISAHYDSSIERTNFLLQPQVDVEKLRKTLNGEIEIDVTHPECDTVTVEFAALPEFEISPPLTVLFNMEPQAPVIEEVWVFNNYGADFEIERVYSEKCCISTVLSQEKINNRYKLRLEITPPVPKDNMRFFTDVLNVDIEGRVSLKNTCRGFYKGSFDGVNPLPTSQHSPNTHQGDGGQQGVTLDSAGTPAADSYAKEPVPRIEFEKVVHDFGEIGAGTNYVCEFKFANAGDGVLEIGSVKSNCPCSVAKLHKKKYAPRESETLKVTYHAREHFGPVKQRVSVLTNDRANARVELTIKADVVRKIDPEPKKLSLSLREKNAACPQITLTSLDGQQFSIESINSTANCITADIDPSKKATRFVLQPNVDIERLQRNPNGRIRIGVTHPECKNVTLGFKTLREFEIRPPSIILRNAEPQKPVTREVCVLNNYNEEFEIESTSSKKGNIAVLSEERSDSRYKLKLKITPPPAKSETRFFSDVLNVKIKGGRKLESTCRGFYLRK